MTINQKWFEKYELLKEYYEEHGNIDVPVFYEKDGIKLGKWLVNQKQAYKKNIKSRLTEDKIKLLEDLGIKWQVYTINWYGYYQLLKTYYEEHGNIHIPTSYKLNGIRLGQWLTNQRQCYKERGSYKITPEKVKLLNQLEIDWSINDTKFLNKKITKTNRFTYQQILLERVNHIIEDLVNEGIHRIDCTNQKAIEKIIIKRIWK